MKGKKLTREDVLNIRVKLSEGYSSRSLAQRYQVSGKTIGDIKSGMTWQNRETPTQDIFEDWNEGMKKKAAESYERLREDNPDLNLPASTPQETTSPELDPTKLGNMLQADLDDNDLL